MSRILTFDLGTTCFKACVFDEAGQLLALARAATPIVSPQAGWSEIPVEAFIGVLTGLVDELRGCDRAAVDGATAISFATQTNSFLLLDGDDRPLTPIIVWNDRRVQDQGEALEALSAAPSFGHDTGLHALGPEFAAAKLLWIKRHQPDLWRRARRFCLIGDYFVHWLTGEHVTEAGGAGLTGLLNIHTLTWREPALTALGMTHMQMPMPRYAGSGVGVIRRKVAERWKLPPGCRCVLGCLDQYAGAIGVGNRDPGGASETTGTVLAAVTLSDAFADDLSQHVIQGPAWRQGLWWRMSFGSISANLLEALRRGEPEDPPFEVLDREAAAIEPGAAGLRLDIAASLEQGQPIFLHGGSQHDRGHRVRAVYEAVAHALRDQLNDLRVLPTTQPILSAGGAARSRLWMQIKADIVGAPFATIDCPEPTSLGVAALAMPTPIANQPGVNVKHHE